MVYGNSDGIDASSSTVSNNRVYDNTAIGINAADSSGNPISVSGNTVYSNSVGIQANFSDVYYYYYSGGTISNNLVYANTNQGLLIVGATSGYTNAITNNTVYQPVGDAIRLQNSPAAGCATTSCGSMRAMTSTSMPPAKSASIAITTICTRRLPASWPWGRAGLQQPRRIGSTKSARMATARRPIRIS